MEEFVLQHAELLAMLDALHVPTIIGLDAAAQTVSATERARLVLDGRALLAARGLMARSTSGEMLLNPLLATVASVLADPQVACLSVRTNHDGQRQLFLHHIAATYALEHTFPEQGQHRLALLPSPAALVPRLSAIFPVAQVADKSVTIQLPQSVLGSMIRLMRQNRRSMAAALLAPYVVSPDHQTWLLDALQQPQLRGVITMLRCHKRTVIAARNPGFLQGPAAAWTIAQPPGDRSTFLVRSVAPDQLMQRFSSWLTDLARITVAA